MRVFVASVVMISRHVMYHSRYVTHSLNEYLRQSKSEVKKFDITVYLSSDDLPLTTACDCDFKVFIATCLQAYFLKKLQLNYKCNI